MSAFVPRLDALPAPQQRLWPELEAIPRRFVLYGELFNPMITLKALSYFADGDLPRLPEEVKHFLTEQAGRVRDIPTLTRRSDQIAPEE